MSPIAESTVEDASLEIQDWLGYTILHGPEITPDPILRLTGGTVLPKLICSEV
jgi:hypothetical protein